VCSFAARNWLQIECCSLSPADCLWQFARAYQVSARLFAPLLLCSFAPLQLPLSLSRPSVRPRLDEAVDGPKLPINWRQLRPLTPTAYAPSRRHFLLQSLGRRRTVRAAPLPLSCLALPQALVSDKPEESRAEDRLLERATGSSSYIKNKHERPEFTRLIDGDEQRSHLAAA